MTRHIGVDAYLYLYPLVLMDITRRVAAHVAAEKQPGFGPPNAFHHFTEYPDAAFRQIVRPNFDTLYSTAFLDLTQEPMIVSTPDTAGRYFLLPMLDMWTDVFASPGWRTTGTRAADYLITAPGWSGTAPASMTQLCAPTPHVWIIGRTQTDGPEDYAAVHRVQSGYRITPLSFWGKAARAAPVKLDHDVDLSTAPKTQIDAMSATQFFAYAAELLKVNPPHLTDEPIIAQLKRIGIEPGRSFEPEQLDASTRAALASAPQEAQQLMSWKTPSIARVVNGWSMNTDTVGVYGNDYLKRAIIARLGLGANLPEDAIYPFNLSDDTGTPLDGSHRYRLHFVRGDTPPAEAFWSITLYDDDGFQVANPLNRYAISSWMPLRYGPDGSLDLYLQGCSPGNNQESNWLPTPQGPFNLTMRIYGPEPRALHGQWSPPPVTRLQ